jgi:hypothetical protein
MPLFGSKSLPDTSYGYSPPSGATAHGWRCANPDCSFAEHEGVRRWPKRCTKCNSIADPLFDEPWKHEARGVELRHKLGQEPSRYLEEEWMVWQHREALRSGDTVRASVMLDETRAYAERQLLEGGWWRPKDIFHGLVWNSLEAAHLEGAANGLVHWWDLSDSDSLETNHASRINLQTLLNSTMDFMEAGGASHPLSAEVIGRARALSPDAFFYLSNFQQAVLRRWAATS